MIYKTLKDRVAVVTGGSRGIGKATAISLAENGARVIVCARKGEDLKAASDLINSSGGRCEYMIADVSDEKQAASLAGEVLRNHGYVDILINNAGVGVYKPFTESSLEDWDTMINTNLRGPFLCSKAFAPSMIKRREGCIINIISGAGKTSMKNLSIYCASKFGLVGLSGSMRKELRDSGVRVLCLFPGYVKTLFYGNFPVDFRLPSKARSPEAVAEEVLRALTQRNKLRFFFNGFLTWLRSIKEIGACS
jgi:3-oxoacyl-[acyl-carrier protein] reductase